MIQAMCKIPGCMAARHYLDCLVLVSRRAPPLLKHLIQVLPRSRLHACMTSDGDWENCFHSHLLNPESPKPRMNSASGATVTKTGTPDFKVKGLGYRV